jgi:hypothetical protein
MKNEGGTAPRRALAAGLFSGKALLWVIAGV